MARQIMKYKESLRYLDTLANFEKLKNPQKNRFLNLERMRYFLGSLGNPEKSFKSVLIGGSKGKGSTAFYLAGSLKASGYRTGLYTSPHLIDVRERIVVNGRLISREDFARLSTQLKELVSNFGKKERRLGHVTYFEFLTLLAFLYFKEKRLDLAVLEAGLGGRLDATNCVDPLLTILTPISLEHTHILGNTVRAIAVEKSFLSRAGRPLISAMQEPSARKVLAARSRKLRSPLYEENKDFFQGPLYGKKPLYALQNFSCVWKALELLKQNNGFKRISFKAALRTFQTKIWPGRFEIVRKRPFVLIDGAHNPASAGRLVESVQLHYPEKKIILILAMTSDKDARGILKALSPLKVESLMVTSFHNSRALPARILYDHAKKEFKNVTEEKSVSSALRKAERSNSAGRLILATGSLSVAGEIKKYYGKT